MVTFLRFRSLLLGIVALGCTYYTDCPNGQCPDDPRGQNGGGSGTSGNGGITGKPPDGEWIGVASVFPGIDAECPAFHLVTPKPDQDELIVGLIDGGLWQSRDGARNFEFMGAGTDSMPVDNRAASIVFDPESSDTFWEAGPYGRGVFRTDDGGDTFEVLGDILHTDNVSVDLVDPERKTLLAGAHEQGRTLFRSTDGGSTWTDIGAGVPSSVKICSYPVVIDAETHLLGCSKWGDGGGGIFRTEDGGSTWTKVSEIGGYSEPLVTSDATIYWAGESLDMQRSDDGGLSWAHVVDGVRSSIRPVELPDGRIATVTFDYVVLTADKGKTWHPVSSKLPPGEPAGITYSAFQKAFFVWYHGCDDGRPESLQRYDFDYAAK